jgi:hypothetical protein
VLPKVALEACLALAEANRVRLHGRQDTRQALVVELDGKGVNYLSLNVYVVVAETVEVLVPSERVALDAIYLMVHLTVRLWGRRAGEEDDLASPHKVANALGSLTWLRERTQAVGFIQDDEVPVLVGQLVHALVVDGEELVRGAQLQGVFPHAAERLFLGQKQNTMHA